VTEKDIYEKIRESCKKDRMTFVVVTRHKGAIDYIKETLKLKEEDVITIDHIDEQMILSMKPHKHVVVGVIPIHIVYILKKFGITTIVLQLPKVSKEMRGKELTPEQMREYGATLWQVLAIEMRTVG